jgi:hypothetical protein
MHRNALFARCLVSVLVLTGSVVTAAAQTTVTACGQEVSGHVILPADLDCTGFDGYSVVIHHGSLAMNGHSITGGVSGIFCDGPCNIIGPGLVTGSTGIGVNAFQTTLKMKSVDVTNHAIYGVQSFKNCLLQGPATISGNGLGVRVGTTAKLRDMTITANQTAMAVGDNAGSGRALVFDSTISGNAEGGVLAQRLVKAVGSTITGNGTIGISTGWSGCDRAGILSIVATTVTGNDNHPDCGTTKVCADLATCDKAPKVKAGSTCDHSYVNGSGNPGSDWDVCSLD